MNAGSFRSLIARSLAVLGLTWLAGAAAAGCASQAAEPAGAGSGSGADEHDRTFRGRVFDGSGELVGPLDVPRVERSDEAWRQQLTTQQHRILRKAGTERPFTGALLENKAEGVYVCAGCRLPLFASDAKFESGTGWPSFFRPIAPENVAEHADRTLGMVRTEITCPRCDGHLGHVFTDGPRPTGLRYCVNSESLAFTAAQDLHTLSEPIAMSTKDQAGGAPAAARAVFAGGCFWCTEAVFEQLEGVSDVVSGYAGGTKETADYKTVCSGKTGHAEAIQITYDPGRIAYEDLLRVHFATHDPTQLNRQGNDVGPQYRSAIFYADEREKALVQAFIDDLGDQGVFKRPVVTTLEPLVEFFPAEAYHQNYVCNNPTQSYVRAAALPKVEKVRKKFADMVKPEAEVK